MNGWRRLFSLFSGLFLLLAAILWYGTYPSQRSDGLETVYDCSLSENELSKQDAQRFLQAGRIPAAMTYNYPEHDEVVAGDCADALEAVANGTAHDLRVGAWWSQGFEGALGIAAFLVFLYALGACLGWVWRGFRPKKSP